MPGRCALSSGGISSRPGHIDVPCNPATPPLPPGLQGPAALPSRLREPLLPCGLAPAAVLHTSYEPARNSDRARLPADIPLPLVASPSHAAPARGPATRALRLNRSTAELHSPPRSSPPAELV